MNNLIKVGEQVRVMSWNLPVTVKRIYFVDAHGNEVFDFESSKTMLELDWGIHGSSKVSLDDEGKTWFRFFNLN